MMTQPTEGGQKPRLLVVDDDKLINKIVRSLFEANGFVVESAFDGREALRMARTFNPHAIVLDVMMPGENGYRVSRFIKSWHRVGIKETPPVIVLLTAREPVDDPEREEVLRGFSLADEVMYKPFDAAALVNAIASRLGSRN